MIDREIVAGGYGYSIFILYLLYIYPIFIVYLWYVIDREKGGGRREEGLIFGLLFAYMDKNCYICRLICVI